MGHDDHHDPKRPRPVSGAKKRGGKHELGELVKDVDRDQHRHV